MAKEEVKTSQAPKNYLEQYDNGNPSVPTKDEITEEQLEELMQLVGNIIFLFNSLETVLDDVIADAINDRAHQPGYAVVSELGPVFTKKILVFKALYGPSIQFLGRPQLTKKFEALVELLFKIKDIRNDVTHADWLAATNKYEVRLRISTDEGGPYAVRKIMTPEFLREKAKELQDIITLIDEFEAERDEAIVGH